MPLRQLVRGERFCRFGRMCVRTNSIRSDLVVISSSAECCICPPWRRWFTTRSRATILVVSAARSLSSNANARSISAVIPAEVQIGSSLTKIRSSCVIPFGNRALNSLCRMCPMHRRMSAIQQPGSLGQNECTAACGRNPSRCLGCLFHESQYGGVGSRDSHLRNSAALNEATRSRTEGLSMTIQTHNRSSVPRSVSSGRRCRLRHPTTDLALARESAGGR
ncbi:hypothetical protein SAMN05421548_110111 [Paraburkholderia lycopersici]|uniref:Uncharacterized protein n=1 Tax=Paraburkholderia lycopersici TaxID=416944 RepID=A0A1G6PDK0_9BURK|nr:hypothetical protein SAMN05421548_110111 [Paraburkholderia lycopersici]